MAAHLVTCLYDGLHHTRICGRLNRGKMYRESLEAISKTGVDITCYTSPEELDGLIRYFNVDRGIINIKFIPFDLYKTYFHADVDAIRDSDNKRYRESPDWINRCVEVMWSKFIFLKDTIATNPEVDYIYWIDAGLSHSGIIHSRFNSHYEDNYEFFIDLDKSRNHLTAQNDLIFNPEFMPDLIRYTGGELLNIASSANQHVRIDTGENCQHKGSVIGGLFGGNITVVRKYCNKIIELFEYYTENKVLHKEEQLMTKVLTEDWFPTKLYVFDSWYHPDWAEPRYNPKLISFCDFFDEIKK